MFNPKNHMAKIAIYTKNETNRFGGKPMNIWRKKFLNEQRGAYKAATLEKIDTHWLIFDSETDEAFPFQDETFKSYDIQAMTEEQAWVSVSFYNSHYLRADEKLIPIIEEMKLRIQTRLSFAYQAWLEELSCEHLRKITYFINDLNYSLFDCIYCHNTAMFENKKHGQGVNFIVFDNGFLPCSLQHSFQYTNGIKEKQCFAFTVANGKKYHIFI